MAVSNNENPILDAESSSSESDQLSDSEEWSSESDTDEEREREKQDNSKKHVTWKDSKDQKTKTEDRNEERVKSRDRVKDLEVLTSCLAGLAVATTSGNTIRSRQSQRRHSNRWQSDDGQHYSHRQHDSGQNHSRQSDDGQHYSRRQRDSRQNHSTQSNDGQHYSRRQNDSGQNRPRQSSPRQHDSGQNRPRQSSPRQRNDDQYQCRKSTDSLYVHRNSYDRNFNRRKHDDSKHLCRQIDDDRYYHRKTDGGWGDHRRRTDDKRYNRKEDSRKNYQKQSVSDKKDGQKANGADPKRRRKKTRVVMPTGIKAYISSPRAKMGANRDCKFVELHNNGRTLKEYETVSREMEKSIMDIPGSENRGGIYSGYEIVKMEKIIDPGLWRRYRYAQASIAREAGFVNERLLFHGTADPHEIIRTGFDERFSNPFGGYGAGVYFADTSSAANEFSFGFVGQRGCPKHNDKSCYACLRKILLCRVSLGKSHCIDGGYQFFHPPPGFHSVIGVHIPGYYKEYVIYRGEQAYPEFLITYKIVK